MVTDPDSNNSDRRNRGQGLVMKTLLLIGGAFVVKRLNKFTTPRDHSCIVSQSLAGEKLSKYAIRDMEEHKNFCDRSKVRRSDWSKDIAEYLTKVDLERCSRGKRCLYEGSTPPEGFPNSWNGATYCTSELAVMRNNETQT